MGKWQLGEEGKTCSETCRENNKYCNAPLQAEITTRELMEIAMAQTGTGLTCKYWAWRSGDVGAPFFKPSSGECFGLTSAGSARCDRNNYSRMRALCQCVSFL